jgi:predicted Zn-dependent protease
VTITARGKDGKSSGWGGQAARNWATMNPMAVTQHAITMAKLGAAPVAFEPGRRTAILSPAAVTAMFRLLPWQFSYEGTITGGTAFSKPPNGTKLKERVFDTRMVMNSNPADPEGGYKPYFGTGLANPPLTWIDKGILRELSYEPLFAMAKGKPYSAVPYSFRLSGGNMTIEEMISRCEEGIYVNRLSSVELISGNTGLMTGVTRDGCFLVRHGKIDKAVKNFRILESPFFFMNRIQALGPTTRAPFGYTPPAFPENPFDVTWPRPPIVVPAMMVSDFNFSALADAV